MTRKRRQTRPRTPGHVQALVLACLAAFLALAPAAEWAGFPDHHPVPPAASAAAPPTAASHGDDPAGPDCGPTPACVPATLAAPAPASAWQRLALAVQRTRIEDRTAHDLWSLAPRAPVPILFG